MAPLGAGGTLPSTTLSHADPCQWVTKHEDTLRDLSVASSFLLSCLEGSELGKHPVTSLPITDQHLPVHAASLCWCFSFQKGYFVTMKVLYTCGYSTSLAALFLAIGIFSCFR